MSEERVNPTSQYVLLGDHNEYYLGKTYIYQGSYFPCVCELNKAKKYSHRMKAQRAVKSLNDKVSQNYGNFDVLEIKEESL